MIDKEKQMNKGKRFRKAVKIINRGVKLKWSWLIRKGQRMKDSAMNEYI